jgi:hypothetical protein
VPYKTFLITNEKAKYLKMLIMKQHNDETRAQHAKLLQYNYQSEKLISQRKL